MRSQNVFSFHSIDTQMIDLGTDKFSPFERASVDDTTCGCCVCAMLVLDKGLPYQAHAAQTAQMVLQTAESEPSRPAVSNTSIFCS